MHIIFEFLQNNRKRLSLKKLAEKKRICVDNCEFYKVVNKRDFYKELKLKYINNKFQAIWSCLDEATAKKLLSCGAKI